MRVSVQIVVLILALVCSSLEQTAAFKCGDNRIVDEDFCFGYIDYPVSQQWLKDATVEETVMAEDESTETTTYTSETLSPEDLGCALLSERAKMSYDFALVSSSTPTEECKAALRRFQCQIRFPRCIPKPKDKALRSRSLHGRLFKPCQSTCTEVNRICGCNIYCDFDAEDCIDNMPNEVLASVKVDASDEASSGEIERDL